MKLQEGLVTVFLGAQNLRLEMVPDAQHFLKVKAPLRQLRLGTPKMEALKITWHC